ncbi:hypothetical protein E2C01_071752 [Portunus trituberculatus]|uniref:Uncharacterized protein n=1 Tax=Portunus trituberculatus TaxID=210409 RepID=A0A5B7HW39_PORTR|nr:hypothetical protein [Portunus trituberculatus]
MFWASVTAKQSRSKKIVGIKMKCVDEESHKTPIPTEPDYFAYNERLFSESSKSGKSGDGEDGQRPCFCERLRVGDSD